MTTNRKIKGSFCMQIWNLKVRTIRRTPVEAEEDVSEEEAVEGTIINVIEDRTETHRR